MPGVPRARGRAWEVTSEADRLRLEHLGGGRRLDFILSSVEASEFNRLIAFT